MDKLTIASVLSLLFVALANKDLELINAVKEGNLTLVTDALASGANPNWQDPGYSWSMVTPLILASGKRPGKIHTADIVLALLNAGADPNLQEYRGHSALNEAAYIGNVDVVPILLSHGADIDQEGKGQTPLMRTIHLNQVEMARILMEHGADPNKKDSQGRTAAARARARGHLRLANLIDNFDTSSVTTVPIASAKLIFTTSLSTTTSTDSTINTSSVTTVPTASAKLSSPTALSATTSTNSTINFSSQMPSQSSKDLELIAAANEGNLTLVTDALASGANPNWQRPGKSGPWATPLMMASLRNHADIALALLNAGADPNLPKARGVTPLNEAAYFGSVDVVPILVSHGANIDQEDNDGQTQLIRTIHLNQVDIARVLLHHGADPNKKDSQGRTAAYRARARGHLRLANLIDNFDTSSVTTVPTASAKLSSPTTPADQRSPKSPNFSLPIQITIACVAMVSMVFLMYMVVMAVKRFGCRLKDPHAVHFENTEELNIHLYNKSDP